MQSVLGELVEKRGYITVKEFKEHVANWHENWDHWGLIYGDNYEPLDPDEIQFAQPYDMEKESHDEEYEEFDTDEEQNDP